MRKHFLAMIACSAILFSACGTDVSVPQEKPAVETAAYAQPEQVSVPAGEPAETAAFSPKEDQKKRTVGGMNYFTFRQLDETYTDEKGRQLLIESLTDPDFYSPDAELSQWVNGTIDSIYASDAAFGQDLIAFARADLEGAGEENFYPYSHQVAMGIARHDENVVSLLSLSSAFSGGAHPNSLQTAYNLDLANLRVLKLEDVIRQSGSEELVSLVCSDIESRFADPGADALFEDYTGTISNALNYGSMTAYWYFTEEGLVIFFNQYELGPYASGIIKAELKYEQLTDILQPEFFPQEHTGNVQMAYMEKKPGEDDWIYYADFGKGETVYVSVDGKADHVQFSEVFWAGKTVVGESMLFSANQVSDGATFAVTGDFSDPEKIYAVEYFDAAGGPYVFYIHGMRVYKELPEIE